MTDIQEIASMFNRALSQAFGLKKFFCLYLTLVFSGLVYLFFQLLIH